MSEGKGKRADRIGAYAEQGNVYIDTLIVEQAEERVRLEGIPQNVPLRGATKFVRRDDELEKIHEQLRRRDRVAISAITGMPGVGKTELAIRYALQYAQEFSGGICWLNAKEPDLVGRIFSFVRLYLHQTIPSELDNQSLTLDQQFEQCLQEWKPNGAVLMVLDDVSETTDFRALVQKLPSRFRVLLTTRVRQLDASFFEVLLDVLAPPKSLELLTELVGSDRIEQEPEAARQLCESLGQLPLGLELVGRFLVKKPWLTLSEMRSQLHLKHEALEQRLATYVMTAEQGVRAAFELSWEELSNRAMEMGRFLSLFAPVAIPWELVQRITERLGWTPEEMETAREQLYSRHLLQPIGATSFNFHPLIREFFTLKLIESERAKHLRSVYVETLVEVAAEIPYTITLAQVAQFAPAIPHLTEMARSDLQFVPDQKLGNLFEGLGNFYEGQGAYAAAEPWCEKGVRVVRNRLGEEHRDYLSTLHNLALLYDSQGRYGEAEPLYLQVRDIQKQILGKEHPNYLTTLHNLALLYSSQGRYGEAKPLYLQVRDSGEQVFGEEHPSYLTTLHNLAVLYNSQGRYGKAESLYLQVRDIQKQVLGKEHPDYLTTLHNLAWLYFSQANFLKFPEATLLYIHVLKSKVRVLGWKHPSTRITIMNLAVFLLVEAVLGWLLLSFAIVFFQYPSWFSLLRFVGYLFLMWLLLRQTITSQLWNFVRRTRATRKQKQR